VFLKKNSFCIVGRRHFHKVTIHHGNCQCFLHSVVLLTKLLLILRAKWHSLSLTQPHSTSKYIVNINCHTTVTRESHFLQT
jgi:hypothetical protein